MLLYPAPIWDVLVTSYAESSIELDIEREERIESLVAFLELP